MPASLASDILALARTAGGPHVDLSALHAQVERYAEIRVAYVDGVLRSVILVDRARTSRGTLIYLGPAFSRGGSYVGLFADLVADALALQEPFAFAIEAENRAVARTLGTLLPTTSYPRAPGMTPAAIASCAAEMLAAIPHVRDFDPATMTSRIVRPLHVGAASRRYDVLFVPCDGSPASRAKIREELDRGLAELAARRAAITARKEARRAQEAA